MNAIKQRRTQLGMKQNELAELIGVMPSAVSMWESGDRTPDSDCLKKLREVLGCTADEILGFDSEPEPTESKRRLNFSEDKLIITAPDSSDVSVRVSRKANALIEEVSKLSGQSKSFVASKMIEFAYERTEIKSEGV